MVHQGRLNHIKILAVHEEDKQDAYLHSHVDRHFFVEKINLVLINLFKHKYNKEGSNVKVVNLKNLLMKVKNKASFLPADYVYPSSQIIINNQRQVLIEQAYELIYFSEIEVKLQLEEGKLSIVGEGLLINSMFTDEITIEGELIKIEFEV